MTGRRILGRRERKQMWKQKGWERNRERERERKKKGKNVGTVARP